MNQHQQLAALMQAQYMQRVEEQKPSADLTVARPPVSAEENRMEATAPLKEGALTQAAFTGTTGGGNMQPQIGGRPDPLRQPDDPGNVAAGAPGPNVYEINPASEFTRQRRDQFQQLMALANRGMPRS